MDKSLDLAEKLHRSLIAIERGDTEMRDTIVGGAVLDAALLVAEIKHDRAKGAIWWKHAVSRLELHRAQLEAERAEFEAARAGRPGPRPPKRARAKLSLVIGGRRNE